MATKEATRTIQEVVNRYKELAKQSQWDQIQDELFAEDALSIEPENAGPGALPNAKGLDEIKKKGAMFNDMVEEMHGGYCSDPVVGGNHFAVAMGMDVTMKGGERMKMDEIAVYEVKNGKIVKEQFFY